MRGQNIHARLSYRPDVDGLRAIAVLAVLLYHANVQGIVGGFVGVDVFFVISGYLITKLLVNEVVATGTIDFYSFYIRRLRRIFPALLFTLAVTSVFAVFFLSSYRLESYGASLLHALFSISNIYFFHESGYFDIDSKQKPLLHTWSLGVEEQFYLIWPVVILLFGAILWKRTLAIGVLAGAGLIAAAWFIVDHPAAVFFLMPFRIFEFMMGGMLVVLERYAVKKAVVNDGLFLSGLVLMGIAILFYSESTRFPGLSALLPCAGAALCIYAGENSRLKSIINNRPFVWVGLISYSLYLVHWPIVVFYRYVFDIYKMTIVDSVVVICLSFIFAVLSYYGIELRCRRPTGGSNQKFFAGISVMFVVLAYTGASMWATDGWKWRPWRTEFLSVKAIEDGKSARFLVRQEICGQKGWENCDDFVPGKVNALIIGDSHAPDALNAFYRIYPSHNYVLSTLGGCPPYREIEKITFPNHPDLKTCQEINKLRHDAEYLRKFDYVVVSVLFGWYSAQHMIEYLEFLKESGIDKVFVVGGYLNVNTDLPELINKYGYSREKLQGFIRAVDGDAVLRPASERLGYFFVSKMDAFCSDTGCKLYDEKGAPFTYDQNHLSAAFSSEILINKQAAIAEYLADIEQR